MRGLFGVRGGLNVPMGGVDYPSEHKQKALAILCSFWMNVCGLFILFTTIAFLVSFGLHQWPGLHWDSAFFAPPVLNVGAHQHWSFGGYSPFLLGRGSSNYDFHGFLHILLFAKLLHVSDWSDYFYWLGIYNAFTVVVYAYLYYRALVRSGAPSLLLVSTLTFMPAALLIGLQGRPEHLVVLLIAIPFLVFEVTQRLDWTMFAAYLCCALILITSPLLGIASSVIVVAILLSQLSLSSRRRWLIRQLGFFLLTVSCVTIIITELFTPLNVLSWLVNVAKEGEGLRNIDFEGIMSSYYHKRYGNTMLIPAWNMLASLAFLSILSCLIQRGASLALLLVVVAGLYFNKRMNDYGYAAFLPILLYIALDRVRFAVCGVLAGIRYRYLLFLIGLVGIIYAYVFSQYVVMSLALRADGHSLAVSRSFMLNHVGSYGQGDRLVSVGYPLRRAPSLVVLGNAGLNFVGFNSPSSKTPTAPDEDLLAFEKRYNTKVEYFLLPQPPSIKALNIPSSIYLGTRRYDFVVADASPFKGRLGRFAGFSRLLLAHHHAYHHAIYKASGLNASPSPHPRPEPGR